MGTRIVAIKSAFLGKFYFRKIFQRRISASFTLLSFASTAFWEIGRCVAIMDGQPWVSLPQLQPSASKGAQLMHHKSSDHNCLGKQIHRSNKINNNRCFVYSQQPDTSVETLKLSPEKNYSLRVKGHTTPNCGGTGIGLILEDSSLQSNQTVWSPRLYVSGDRTVFEAEYSAIIFGMDYAYNVLEVRRLTVFFNNDIIVNQIRGNFTVTKPSLKILLDTIKNIQQRLQIFAIEEIASGKNSRATTRAIKALATRKSLNIEDRNWKVQCHDPIRNIRRNPLKMGRWRKPDDPAQSATIDPSKTYRLQFDGGAKECIGVGMVLYDDKGKEIWCGWHFHPEAASNNIAEYMGLVCGLRCARSLGVAKLIVEGDSLLVVRQMNDMHRKRDGELVMFRREARELIKDLSYCQIRKISRMENKRADWLANHAMTLRESDGFIRMAISEG